MGDVAGFQHRIETADNLRFGRSVPDPLRPDTNRHAMHLKKCSSLSSGAQRVSKNGVSENDDR